MNTWECTHQRQRKRSIDFICGGCLKLLVGFFSSFRHAKSHVINCLCCKVFDIEFSVLFGFSIPCILRPLKSNETERVRFFATKIVQEIWVCQMKTTPIGNYYNVSFDKCVLFGSVYTRIWANLLIGSICRLASAATTPSDDNNFFLRTSNFRHWARAMLEVFKLLLVYWPYYYYYSHMRSHTVSNQVLELGAL